MRAGNLLALCLLFAAPLPADVRTCLARPASQQKACVAKLELAALTDFLGRSDGETDDRSLVAVLDALRARGRSAAPAAESVSALLRHRHPLYRERDKPLVIRLRAYLLATLADIGTPESALPPILDILAYVDELSPLETGAAARAVRSLGTRGRPFAPYLAEALRGRSAAEEFSLERYDPDFPSREATTVQLEVIRTLAAIGAVSDPAVSAALGQLAADTTREDPRAVRAAQRELQRLGGAK